MDMLPVQARFSSQEKAEAAVRKLASLRGDRFRLEREAPYAADGTPEVDTRQSVDGLAGTVLAGQAMQFGGGIRANDDAAAPVREIGPEGAPTAIFALSARVPSEVAEQARSVILDSGGEMM